MVKRVIFNGKFLSAVSTGVHRVAHEIIAAYGHNYYETDQRDKGVAAEIWMPSNASTACFDYNIPVRTIGRLKGIPWEQLELALKSGRAIVVNLCNIGPILHPKSVTMIHDAQVHSSPDSYGLGFRIWYKFNQPFCGWTHKEILTVSQFSKEELVKYFVAKPEKIRVVHNGVDHILSVKPAARALAKYNLVGTRYFVALANTQPHKNISILLKAFDQPTLQEMQLALVGTATRQDFEVLGHHVPSNVKFLGRVSDEELIGLYQGAQSLLFPSKTEGFGLPPLEAMTIRCPAIVAPCGALPEVCDVHALYASPDDVDEWVAQIMRIIEDDGLRAKLVESGQNHAANFTWKNAACKLREVIGEID